MIAAPPPQSARVSLAIASATMALILWLIVGVPDSWAAAWLKTGAWAALALLCLALMARLRAPSGVAGALGAFSVCCVFLAACTLFFTQTTAFELRLSPGNNEFGFLPAMTRIGSIRDVLIPAVSPALLAGCYGFAAARRWPKRCTAEAALLILGLEGVAILLLVVGR